MRNQNGTVAGFGSQFIGLEAVNAILAALGLSSAKRNLEQKGQARSALRSSPSNEKLGTPDAAKREVKHRLHRRRRLADNTILKEGDKLERKACFILKRSGFGDSGSRRLSPHSLYPAVIAGAQVQNA
jgi:hypothetical protein